MQPDEKIYYDCDGVFIYAGLTAIEEETYKLSIQSFGSSHSILSELIPATLAAQGKISGVAFQQKDFIHQVYKCPPTFPINGICCNYGEVYSEEFLINHTEYSSCIAYEDHKIGKKKIQGSGRSMNSQVTFHIADYQIRVFQNGVVHIPGINDPSMLSIIEPCKAVVRYLNKIAPLLQPVTTATIITDGDDKTIKSADANADGANGSVDIDGAVDDVGAVGADDAGDEDADADDDDNDADADNDVDDILDRDYYRAEVSDDEYCADDTTPHPIKLVWVSPLMRNYKCRLLDETFSIDLSTLEKILIQEKKKYDMSGYIQWLYKDLPKIFRDRALEYIGKNNIMNIATMEQASEKGTYLNFKIDRPATWRKGTGQCTIKIFNGGKINLNSCNSELEAEEIYLWLQGIFNKYAGEIFLRKTDIPNRYDAQLVQKYIDNPESFIYKS